MPCGRCPMQQHLTLFLAPAVAATAAHIHGAAALPLPRVPPPHTNIQRAPFLSLRSHALQIQAENEEDKVFITYSVLPAFEPNATDTVQLKACYSNFSQVDRPWRASNNIIAVRAFCVRSISLRSCFICWMWPAATACEHVECAAMMRKCSKQ